MTLVHSKTRRRVSLLCIYLVLFRRKDEDITTILFCIVSTFHRSISANLLPVRSVQLVHAKDAKNPQDYVARLGIRLRGVF
jgi:hypothetical protein